MKPLRVVHLSSSDIGGGAAIAAYRLHQGLLRVGVDSQMVVGEKLSDDSTVHGPARPFDKLWSRLSHHIDQVPRKLLKTTHPSLISPAWVLENTLDNVLALQPDIINLHWIANGFIRLESLRRLTSFPLVWTLHDMWAFTGGEHYAGDDKRYIIGYTKENRPTTEQGYDINRWVWQRKMRVIPQLEKLTVVTDSNWLAECARLSRVFQGRRVVAINYGLNSEIFKPIPKAMARWILNLPTDKKIIIFGAVNAVQDTRKGIDLLAAALQHYAAQQEYPDAECYIFGASQPKNPHYFGLPSFYLGTMSDEVALALLYSAADVMVVPSREEAFGQTALESLACGTPVVAFHVGGLPDTVEHEQTGYLARPFDIGDLARGIGWVLSDDERWKQLSEAGRNKVLNGFTLEHQAIKYQTVYQDLLHR